MENIGVSRYCFTMNAPSENLLEKSYAIRWCILNPFAPTPISKQLVFADYNMLSKNLVHGKDSIFGVAPYRAKMTKQIETNFKCVLF